MSSKSLLFPLFLLSFVSFSFCWRSSLYPSSWTPGDPELLQDLSYAGYRKTGVRDLPPLNNPGQVYINVTDYGADPTGTLNSTSFIQSAINQACSTVCPTSYPNCHRVVYFGPGTYKVSRPGATNVLTITCDRVILRGAGENSTFLFHDSYVLRSAYVITAGDSSTLWANSQPPKTWPDYLVAPLVADTAVGDWSVRVNVTSAGTSFRVGDWIVLENEITTDWLTKTNASAMGWSAHRVLNTFFRQVTLVQNHTGGLQTLGVDIPIQYPLQLQYNAKAVRFYKPYSEIGIEYMSVGNRMNPNTTDSLYTDVGSPAYWADGATFFRFVGVVDSWIRNVATYQPPCNDPYPYHILSVFLRIDNAARCTIANCRISWSQFNGANGNGYALQVLAQDNLFYGISTYKVRHGFSVGYQWGSGNVFSNCSDNSNFYPSDFHMFFSAANLVDMHRTNYTGVYVAFRPNSFPVHGFVTSETVVWNVVGTRESARSLVQSSQYGTGYLIGTKCYGVYCKRANPPTVSVATNLSNTWTTYTFDASLMPDDHIEGVEMAETLEPQSLYADQLSRRCSLSFNSSCARPSVTYFTPQSSALPAPTPITVFLYGPNAKNENSSVSFVDAQFNCSFALSPDRTATLSPLQVQDASVTFVPYASGTFRLCFCLFNRNCSFDSSAYIEQSSAGNFTVTMGTDYVQGLVQPSTPLYYLNGPQTFLGTTVMVNPIAPKPDNSNTIQSPSLRASWSRFQNCSDSLSYFSISQCDPSNSDLRNFNQSFVVSAYGAWTANYSLCACVGVCSRASDFVAQGSISLQITLTNPTPTPTPTPSPTPTPTPTPSFTSTPSPTSTASPTATLTPTLSPTPTSIPTSTLASVESASPTPDSATLLPTIAIDIASPSPTPSPPTPTPTPTDELSSSFLATFTPTLSPSLDIQPTPASDTQTPAPSPSSDSPTASMDVDAPTATGTPLEQTCTATPSLPSPSPTPSVTPAVAYQQLALTVSNVTSTSLVVSWSTPCNVTISFARVDPSSASPHAFIAPVTNVTVLSPMTSQWISGLQPAAFYGFLVDDGQQPETVEIRMPPAEAPDCSTTPLNITSASFTSGVSAEIEFSLPVVNISSRVPCSSLFSPPSLTLLGPSPTCSWQAPSTLSLLFSSHWRKNTSSLHLLRIGTACGIVPFFGLEAWFELPESRSMPVAVLKAPKVISACGSGVVLDGSFSTGGFAAMQTYLWTASDPALNATLSQASGPFVSLNSSALAQAAWADGAVSFELVVANAFGDVSLPSVVNVTRQADAPPLVTILSPPALVHYSPNVLRIQGSASAPPSCGAANATTASGLKLQWTISPLPAIPIAQSVLASPELVLPRYTLLPNATYTVMLNATSRHQSSQASVVVTVGQSPVYAVIAGGNRKVSAVSPLVLDGSLSYDADNTTAEAASYAWSCCTIDTQFDDCVAMTCPSPQSDVLPRDLASPVLSYAPTLGSPFVEGTFRYSLTYSKGQRTSTASVTVTFVQGSFPAVSIAVQGGSVGQSHVPSNRLVLRASSVNQSLSGEQTPFSFSWEVLGAQLDLSNSSIAPLGHSSQYLVIEKNSMASGMTYTFRVTVWRTAPAAAVGSSGFAEVRIQTSGVPCGGTIAANASQAVSGRDWVQLTALSWTSTDPNDAQLMYSFEMESAATGRVSLSDYLVSPSATFRAPFVDQPTQVAVRVFVKNSDGAVAQAIGSLQLVPLPPTDMGHLASGLLSASLAAAGSEPTETLQNIVFLSNVWNNDAALQTSSVVLGALNALSAAVPSLEILSSPAKLSTLSTAVSNLLSRPSQLSLASAQTALSVMSTACPALATATEESGVDCAQTAKNFVTSLGNVVAALPSIERAGQSADGLAAQAISLINTFSNSLVSELVPGESTSVSSPQLSLHIQRALPSDLQGRTLTAPQPQQSGQTVTMVSLPAALLGTMPSDRPLDVQSVVWATNPWSASPTSENMTSLVFSLKLKVGGAEVPVQQLAREQPVQISLAAQGVSASNASCRFYNETSGRWSTAGGTLHSVVGGYVTCNWTHLTDFAVFKTAASGNGSAALPAAVTGGDGSGAGGGGGGGVNVGLIASCAIGGLAVAFVITIIVRHRRYKKNQVTPTVSAFRIRDTNPATQAWQQPARRMRQPHETYRRPPHQSTNIGAFA